MRLNVLDTPSNTSSVFTFSEDLIEQNAEMSHLLVTDLDREQSIRSKQSTSQQRAIEHHAHPTGVLIAILVGEVILAGVIRRIDVDAFHPLPIPRLHEAQRLEVLAMEEHAVHMPINISHRFE